MIARVIFFLIVAAALVGCEGQFAGKRAYNIQILNGNYEMKIVSLASTSYLAVLNTNFRFHASTGSLQFYSLADARNPTRVPAMSLELPSNVGDFVIDGTTLYVADRTKHQILVYDFSGTAFSARLDSFRKPLAIKVADQPQKLLVFSRLSDNVKTLAVVSQTTGLIHFIRTDTFAFMSKGDTQDVTPDLITLAGVPSLEILAYPRRTTSGRDDPIHFPSIPSYGINDLVYLDITGKTDQLFVSSSGLAMGLFGVRLDRFTNISNLSWNLPKARDGETVNDVDYPGTKENGFRGLARDGQANVFAISRTDNSLYKISRSEFEREKETAGTETTARRNTLGFDDDAAEHRIVARSEFDSDLTDKKFPCLGPVAVNFCPNAGGSPPAGCTVEGAAATVAWVLGLGTYDGDTPTFYPKVYRIDLGTNTVTDRSADGALGDTPQKLLWYRTATDALLYVANTRSDTITILNDSDLSVVKTIEN